VPDPLTKFPLATWTARADEPLSPEIPVFPVELVDPVVPVAFVDPVVVVATLPAGAEDWKCRLRARCAVGRTSATAGTFRWVVTVRGALVANVRRAPTLWWVIVAGVRVAGVRGAVTGGDAVVAGV
jgi:hypothetical protein